GDLSAADLDGDGLEDLISARYHREDLTISAYAPQINLRRPEGGYASPIQPAIAGTAAKTVFASDLDGDGAADPVFMTHAFSFPNFVSRVEAFRTEVGPQTSFVPRGAVTLPKSDPNDFFLAALVSGATAADFDGDGLVDIAAISEQLE